MCKRVFLRMTLKLIKINQENFGSCTRHKSKFQPLRPRSWALPQNRISRFIASVTNSDRRYFL